MAELEPYSSAAGVESAIAAAARSAARSEPLPTTNERIALEYFNRFLSRVFSEGPTSEWVLKGGTSMLARLPSARATQDVDLFRSRVALEDALKDLRSLANVDLGDHLRFEYVDHTPSIGTNAQPHTDGFEVRFNIFIGASPKGSLKVDLTIGELPTGNVITVPPESALHLPRLISHDYRLYPVVDQIADKVCATMATYTGRTSSREKDLVDLVALATTQEVDGNRLRIALATEAARRKLELGAHFRVPPGWGRGYEPLSRGIPYCAGHRTLELALDLVTRFIDPALTRAADGKLWSPTILSWN